MNRTKNLLVPKQQLLAIALFWTGIIAYFCLVQSKDVPVINIPNIDKYIHAFFHFVFTVVWFLFFNKITNNSTRVKALLISIVLSILFGVLIEIIQKLYTTTRTADVLDFYANLAGATLAAGLILLTDLNNTKNKLE